MVKQSHQCPVRYEKDQVGCMWGLISMFDFWHGRTTPGLLQDGRNSNRNAIPGRSPRKDHDMLALGVNCQGKLDEGQATDTCRPSVKKLIGEEISGEKASKNEKHNARKEMKQHNSGSGDKKQNSCKRKKQSRSKSLDNIYDLDTAGTVGYEGTCHHRSHKQSSSSQDIGIIMEELCSHIYQRSIDCLKRGQDGEIQLLANQETAEFKEKLCEAVKFLVSQKLMNENFLTEDGELQTSKEILEALQILSSDEELFLKLLQDPNSLVVRYVPDFPDAQVKKDEEFKSLLGSKFSEPKLVNLTKSNELAHGKKHRFFRRRSKPIERETMNENKDLQASNEIVILKPGPATKKNPETGSSPDLATKSHYIIRNKEANGKVGSQFLLAEIKRKLKHAMGKDHHRSYSDGEFPAEHQNVVDGGVATEYFGMSSPTEDHFLTEKIGRHPISARKGEGLSGPKDCKIGVEHETADFSKKNVTNIYIEAKKHLFDLLNSGHEYVHVSSRQSPNTLGKILALPNYNVSPISSPGRQSDTAHMRFTASGEFQKSNDNLEHKHGSNLSPTAENSETQTWTSDDGINNRKEDNNINTLVEAVNDKPVEGTSSSINHKMTVEVTPRTIEETETTVREKNNSLDTFSGPSSSSINKDDGDIDRTQVFDESLCPECSRQNSCEEDQHPFSHETSPPNSSVTKKVEYAQSFNDVQERPSPISVLEPLFMEDDISPTSTRSRAAETSLQPIKIQFNKCGSSVANESHHTITCTEDKELVFEYVQAVLQVSSLNWDKLCVVSFSSDQLLDPSLLDEVELSINQLCPDQKILFDCINEVVMELCMHYFGCSPWVSFVNPHIRPIPNMENFCQEVCQGIYWHLVPIPLTHTLDQIVRKDMDKMGTWLDLRHEADCISTEIGEAILEDLMETTWLAA